MMLLLGAYHWVGCNDLHFISEGLCDALPQEFAESKRTGEKKKDNFVSVMRDPCSAGKKACCLTGVCSCHIWNRLNTRSQFSIPRVLAQGFKTTEVPSLSC